MGRGGGAWGVAGLGGELGGGLGGGLGWAGQGWAGLGWAGLGWAGWESSMALPFHHNAHPTPPHPITSVSCRDVSTYLLSLEARWQAVRPGRL